MSIIDMDPGKEPMMMRDDKKSTLFNEKGTKKNEEGAGYPHILSSMNPTSPAFGIEENEPLSKLISAMLDNTTIGRDPESMEKGGKKDLALLKQWKDKYGGILSEIISESVAPTVAKVAAEGDFTLYEYDDGADLLSEIDELEMIDISETRKRKPLPKNTTCQHLDACGGLQDLPANGQVKSPSLLDPQTAKSNGMAVSLNKKPAK